MTWLALLKIVLSLADKIFDHLQQKNLMTAGEARAIAFQMEQLNERVQLASKARDDVAADVASGGLHTDDGYRTDKE